MKEIDPQIETRINSIVERITGEKVIARTDELVADLGLTFATRIELACALEDDFDISIPDATANEFATVGDLVKYVQKEISKEFAHA